MSSAKRSRRFPYGLIIIALLIALGFATNPSEKQFTTYLKERISDQAKGDETLAGDLTRLFSGPAASLAGLGAVRTDYFLFSTYRMDLPGEDRLYLGIFDNFVRLK